MRSASEPGPLRRAAPLLVAVVALAVAAAVVGTGSQGGGDVLGRRGLWSAVGLLADALTGALAAAGVLCLLLLVWALRDGHRREATGSRRSMRQTLVGLVLLALGVPAAAWLMSRGDLGVALLGLVDAVGAAGEAPVGGATPAEAALDPGVRTVAAAAGAALVLVAAAAWWWRAGVPDGTPPAYGGSPTASLVRAVDRGIDDLDAEADARSAVLRCFARLDAALAEAGCARGAAETAREHCERARMLLGPGASAAASLVDRFERARYDAEPVTEKDRTAALAALRDARTALERQRDHPLPTAGGSG